MCNNVLMMTRRIPLTETFTQNYSDWLQ